MVSISNPSSRERDAALSNGETTKYTFRMMRHDLSWELHRYVHRLYIGKLQVILFTPGFQATVVYRLGHWLLPYTKKSGLGIPVSLLMAILRRFTEIITGIYISPEAEIGAGLLMLHFGGIVVGPAKIGRNCELFHGVTLGVNKSGETGVPEIGDRVYLAPGAKILGAVTVGNDVCIGANAVLATSVQDRWVMMGNPVRRITKKGSFDMVIYPGMEFDPDRQRSMEAMAAARVAEESSDRLPVYAE
ncbi:MAG: serine acetyltransferase [Anaerolineae bacterium]